MNIKYTFALLFVAIVAGIVYLINPFNSEEAKVVKPWFYQVHVDDMMGISIDHMGDNTSFVRTESNTWAFDTDQLLPPDRIRWGAVDFLLGGPQTKRDLSETTVIIEDPAQYGLDNPHTIVTINLTLNRTLQFKLGDKTTDGNHHYGQVTGFPQLFLIADVWGDVIARMVTEPPLPQWYTLINPQRIDEINIFEPSPDPENQTNYVSYLYDDKAENWTLTDFRIDETPRPVNQSKFLESLNVLRRPENVAIQVHRVPDKDYTEWGISENGMLIEIRYDDISEEGRTYKKSNVFLIGDTGKNILTRYGRPDNADPYQPVLILPEQWVTTVFELLESSKYKTID